VTAQKDAAESLANSRQEELATLRAELEKITAQSKSRLEIGLKHQVRVRETTAQIAEKDKEITSLKEKVESTNKEIENTKTKIGELEKKLADAEKINTQKDAIIQKLNPDQASRGSVSSPPSVATDNSALVSFN